MESTQYENVSMSVSLNAKKIKSFVCIFVLLQFCCMHWLFVVHVVDGAGF